MADMISVNAALEKIAFAKEAAEDFQINPQHTTFGTVEEDSFFGVRWGLDGKCVLVFTITKPTIFTDF